MEVIDAILLGIIQGLTEFLPVSSSGHLELGKAILGDNSVPEESLLFTVVLHFATALSTIVVFRKDIYGIIKGVFAFKWNEDTKFVAKIAVSMLPAAIIGFTFESELSALFGGNIKLVGFESGESNDNESNGSNESITLYETNESNGSNDPN